MHCSSYTLQISSLKVQFGSILYLSCLYLSCWVFPPSSWDMEYSHNNILEILLFIKSIICILPGSVLTNWFFSSSWIVFSCLFACLVLLLGCQTVWILLCWMLNIFAFIWRFLSLFWNAVKLLGYSLIISGLIFKFY